MKRISYLAIWVALFTVPWQYSFAVPQSLGTVSRATGLIAIAVGFIGILAETNLRTLRAVHFGAIVYVLWNCLEIVNSGSPSDTRGEITFYVQVLFLLFLVWQYSREERDLLGFDLAFVLGGIFSAAFTIYAFLTGNFMKFMGSGRYYVGEWNPNSLAITLALVVPVSIVVFGTHPSKLVRTIAGVSLVLIPFAVTLTASRGGMVNMVVCYLGIGGMAKGWSIFRKFAVVALLGIATLIVIYAAPPATLQRLATTQSAVSTGDMNGRKEVWQAAVPIIEQHPLVGVGPGCFTAADPLQMNAHNTYISVLAEEGLIGLIIFLGWVWLVVRSTRFMQAGTRAPWIFGILGWAAGAATGLMQDDRVTWVLFALLIAHSGIHHELEPEETPETPMVLVAH